MPESVQIVGDIAVDTEAMGLNNKRDRLCVVQISQGNGDAHIIHFPTPEYNCPRLKEILADPNRQKIFHFARFDVAIIELYLGFKLSNIFCTKIASRLSRTYTDMHGLKDLCLELLSIKLNKQQQTSDWGAQALSNEQVDYAANDVLHLHKLREKLVEMLKREGRLEIAKECFNFLPTRSRLDTLGWLDCDIFQH